MQREDMWQGPPGGGSKPQHVAAAFWAVVLSVAFHALIIQKLPSFPLGIPLSIQEAVRYPAIHVQDVNRFVQPAVDASARLRTEDPNRLAELLGVPDLGQGATAAPPLPDVPEPPSRKLQGEQQAVALPEAGHRPAVWEPRADILQIQDRIYADDVSALPRRYVERIDRSAQAPDIVLPIDRPAEMEPGRITATADLSADEQARRLLEGQSGAGLGLAQGGDGRAAADALFPDEAAVLKDVEGPAREIQPIEQYLDLEIFVYRAPDEKGAAYFEMRIRRHGPEALPVLPKDLLVLQDCSESMTAWKLSECKRGLRRALDSIHARDRFDVIAFSDTVRPLFNAWQENTAENRTRALRFIDDMRASGNTDVYASLQAAAGRASDPSRPFIVVLVTDGRPTMGVTDSSEIIERFTRENGGRISIYTMAGGRKVNRFLVDMLSYRNRGDSRVVVDPAHIADAVERMAVELSRPVLADLSYRFTGLRDEEIFPKRLTHLFLDRPLVIYGRLDHIPENVAVQIVGRSGGALKDMIFPLDFDKASAGNDDIRRQWAWHKVYHLMAEHIRTGERRYLDQLQVITRRYGLVLPFWSGSSAQEALPR